MTQENIYESFVKLIQEHKKIIFKICGLYADSEIDRQDLSQEILLQTWKSFPGFRRDSKFSTWFYQIAINTALTRLNREKKSVTRSSLPEFAEELMDSVPNPTDAERSELLYEAIAQLNEIEKAIVLLYLEDKTYDEMSSIMGMSNGAIRTKMTRVREKLKKINKK